MCIRDSLRIAFLIAMAASLRYAPVSWLDDSDHFRDNQFASVAALRSLIGIRRKADRLPSGTLIDFPRIRKKMLGGPN